MGASPMGAYPMGASPMGASPMGAFSSGCVNLITGTELKTLIPESSILNSKA
jgi:hypothetical protein